MKSISLLLTNFWIITHFSLSQVKAQSQAEINALHAIKDALAYQDWGAGEVCGWPGVFCNPQGNITGIDLSEKGIGGPIPPQMGDLIHLEFLWLDGNNFYRIPPEIENLKYLESLNLAGNGISEIPNEISGLSNLHSLNLDQNPLQEIPASFGQLTNLELLIFGGGTFVSLPDELADLINLKALLIYGADFIKVPEVIFEITSLEILTIFDTPAGEIPADIKALTQLRQLNLGRNRLRHLPPELLSLPNLEELVLRNNYLTLSDLGPYHPGKSGLDRLLYSPQYSEVANQLVYGHISGNASFTIPEILQGSSYQWFQQGNDSNVYGTGPVLEFTSIEKEDFGHYYCTITHPDFPDFTFSYAGYTLEEFNQGMDHATYRINGNPFKSRLNITIENGLGRNHEFYLIDNSGRKVFHARYQPSRNIWSVNIPTGKLSAGLYHLVIIDQKESGVEKFTQKLVRL